MTEHDLPMLHDWLNRSHIVEWWGGEDNRPSLKEVYEEYMPTELAEIQTDPAPDNHRAIRCYEKVGFVQHGEIVTPDGPAIYMVQTRSDFKQSSIG